jgi:hypothetical protein
MNNTERLLSTEPPSLELHVIIANDDRAHDTRLRFELKGEETARLWLVRLPALRDYDAFPRPLTPNAWELRLAAVADTRPLEITDYTRALAMAWLRRVNRARPESGATELLILASQWKFNTVIMEF